MNDKRCEAAADPSKLGGPRCGAPATFESLLGYRCDACAVKFREACRNPRTFANVIAGRARTEEEIAQLIRPIQRLN